ncbi:MAG: tetratricopeptide repeat protein [Polyangia bacterium]
MNCPRCASTNRPGATTCRRCQSDIARSCAGCGQPVSDDSELCIACRTSRVPAALGAEVLDSELLTEDEESLARNDEPRFVGRTAILARLVERACVPERGPSFVSVLGPAGIGKTRLCAELAHRIVERDANARVLRTYAGDPSGAPYAAFRRLFSIRFGIALDEHDEVLAREQLSQVVEATVGPVRALEVSHLLAHLVGFPFPDSVVVQPLADSPSQLQARTFIAVRRFFEADAKHSRLTLVLDDVERASAETINLLHYLAVGLADLPVLIICVGRPELFEAHPTFGDGELVLERIQLEPLSADEAAELLSDFAGVSPLPDELALHAKERMETTPRALESLVRYLRETLALVRESDESPWHFDAARLRTLLPLPRELAGIVTERLRAMPAYERDVLQKAAACGEAFWLDAVVALIRAIALDSGDPDGPTLGEVAAAGDRTRHEVGTVLQDLVERGLLVEEPEGQSTIAGEREFRFAAPPWFDVVYAGLDDDRRRRYHRLVAQWLELRPRGRGEEEQEEIGRHLERAGEAEGAAMRYRRAADAARARYFNDKAIRLYVAALGCLGPHDVASRIHLWHDLGSVFHLKGDYDSALGAFERMLRLSWVVASRAKAAVAFNKMGRVYRHKSDLPLALEYFERGLELFEQASDTRGVAGSCDDIGQVLWLMSRYDEALDRSASGLEMRRQLGDKGSVSASLMHIGNIERHRGLFDAAQACYAEALELRTTLSDAAGIIEAHNGLGMLAFHRGDLVNANAYWQTALDRAVRIGSMPLEALLLNHLGEVARASGQRGEARTRFDAARALAVELDDRRLLCESLYNLGLLELADGRNEDALAHCTEALQLAETAGIRVDVGRALLALGEVHAATIFDDTGSGTGTADDYYQRGIALFREIGNDAELGHGLMRYGQYRLERTDTEGGRTLLAEAQIIFGRLGMKSDERLLRVMGETELA